jgi:hypothetical protein
MMPRKPYRSNRRTTSLLGVAVLFAATLAQADRQPLGLTTIKRSPTSGAVEIIHRLHTHDAELGLNTLLDQRIVSLDTLEGRARFALYVESRFVVASVADGNVGAPLALELIGAELDGQYLLVYQELRGDFPATVAVRSDILRDVFPEQVNQVNIAVGGDVRTLMFRDDDTWRMADVGGSQAGE